MGGYVLGEERFQQEIAAALGRRVTERPARRRVGSVAASHAHPCA